jgi:dihydromonapterin reductase/dihydrofolate reductase
MKPVLFITGIGKRLGLEMAKHFLDKGFQLIGTYRTKYDSIDELISNGADLYQVDFYDQEAVDNFINHIQDKYTYLNGIIHNASDWLPDNNDKNNADYNSAQIIQKMMTIHASIPYQINLAFQKLLINSHVHSNDFADVIHISDYVAEKGSKKHIAYAASKTAMNSLTLSFSSLLSPKVKVNSISPALIKFNEQDDDSYKEKAFSKALLAKEAGYSEIIKAIEFIFSSKFMTGRNLQIDGGRHLK